jgi:hypothetical protein
LSNTNTVTVSVGRKTADTTIKIQKKWAML